MVVLLTQNLAWAWRNQTWNKSSPAPAHLVHVEIWIMGDLIQENIQLRKYEYYIYVNIHNWITFSILSFRTWKYAQTTQHTWKYWTTNFCFWYFFFETPTKLRFCSAMWKSEVHFITLYNKKIITCARLHILRVLNHVEVIILSNSFSFGKYTAQKIRKIGQISICNCIFFIGTAIKVLSIG